MRQNMEKRKSIMIDTEHIDYIGKKGDFIEITEWVNGEGIDVVCRDQMFNLTFSELDAIKFLVIAMDYNLTISKDD